MKSTALVLYTIILNMSQEIEYIWLNSFSPPVFFYTLTRYAILIGGGLLLAADLLPMPVVSNRIPRISVKPLLSSSHYCKTLPPII